MTDKMFGPYRLDGLLGRGGMGEVWRAYHTEQDRTVALKLLLDGLGRDDEFRRRFLRESQVTARLNDPHVIPIHNWGEIDGRLYLDMRYVEGEDLGQRLARLGPLPPDRAVRVLGQVARALDSAHRSGLVHRDVKPSNVLLANVEPHEDDFAYLVDFGIARSLTGETSGTLTIAGTAVGTLDYMAPERFLEQPVDHRADVYALTCMLYEVMTGQRPFLVDGLAAQMSAHIRTPPPRVSTHTPVPPVFDGVIARGMAKDPEERYATAGALATAARAAITSPIQLPARVSLPVAAGWDAPHAERPRADATRVDAARPDGARADVPQVDVPRVDMPRVDVPRVDSAPADLGRPITARPEAPQTDATRPDSAQPEPLRPDHRSSARTATPPSPPSPPPWLTNQAQAGPPSTVRPAAEATVIRPQLNHPAPGPGRTGGPPPQRQPSGYQSAPAWPPVGPPPGPPPGRGGPPQAFLGGPQPNPQPPAARKGRTGLIVVIAVVVAVALIALVVVLANGVAGGAGGGDDGGGDDQPTAAQQEFLAILPAGFTAANCTTAPERENAQVDAAYQCASGPAGGPSSAVFLRYRTADQLAAASDGVAAQRSLGPADVDTCRDGSELSGTWSRAGEQQGLILCYVDSGTGANLEWTDNRVLGRAIVTRSDADAQILYDWWLDNDFT